MTNKIPTDAVINRTIKYSESDIPKEFFILTGQEVKDPSSDPIIHLIIAYQPSKWTILRDDADLVCLVRNKSIPNLENISVHSTVTVSKQDLMISEKWESATLHINEWDVQYICQSILPQLFANPNNIATPASQSIPDPDLPNYIIKTFPVWHYL